MAVCIAENSGGKGGIAGGAGAEGQASQSATGAGASSYGYPVLECVTGMEASFDIQLTKDYNGEIPSDLSEITRVQFIAKPTMHGDCPRKITASCDYTDDGKVSLKLTPDKVNFNEGVWYCEFLCYRNEVLVQTYRSYLCIRKGMTGHSNGVYPVTPMDIRLALMDTSAECNELLDDLEFSDVMILNAIERAVNEWEEMPPKLSRHFDATNFPYREALIKGASGYLLQSVMYRYMRNQMRYSAAGLTMDKNDKGQVYLQLSATARAEWKAFIAAAKTSMNMEECCGVIEMPWFDDRIW